MEHICRAYGFQESALSIIPKLTDGTWALLEEQDIHAFTSRLGHGVPAVPLTNLQKAWLKSLTQDPRFQLFFTDRQLELLDREWEGLPFLYREDDFYCYDRYRDGDSYGSLAYRKHFQAILKAIREERIILVAYEGKHGRIHAFEAAPYQLQYSSKDDKFRLCCLQFHRNTFSRGTILNLARIKDCRVTEKPCPADLEYRCFKTCSEGSEPVVLEISGERNSLERCMLHFANYEKHTEYDGEKKCWICSIHYDLADETELLIDILSFGPVVRVLGPSSFVRQIRKRVKRQHELFYSDII
uniref:WYL domain-containing protein n=1 Tax=Enterocloster clostridioformis TaxID=1531 RepID=UPI0026EEF193|nr:WYL domain-containing protein [Enterocloster clostridioformis]